MKVAAYVPIKLNSQRVPGKNLKRFDDGTPLCRLMFQTLARVKEADESYCFCSDEAIRDYLPEGIAYLKRSALLDTPDTQCHEIIRSFTQQVEADIYVLAHATCPFVRSRTISECIRAVAGGSYDSAFTATQVREFLWKDGEPLNFDPSSAVRTQELPTIYRETVGVYVFTRKMFLETNRKVGLKPYICEVGAYEGMDIDEPEDFETANAVYMRILRQRQKTRGAVE